MIDNDERYEEYAKRCREKFLELYGAEYPTQEEYSLLSDRERSKVWGVNLAARWFEDFQHTVQDIIEYTDLTRTEALMLIFGSEILAAKHWIIGLNSHKEDEDREPWQ